LDVIDSKAINSLKFKNIPFFVAHQERI